MKYEVVLLSGMEMKRFIQRLSAEESSSDFSDWVEDAPDDYVDFVVGEWKKGNPNSADITMTTLSHNVKPVLMIVFSQSRVLMVLIGLEPGLSHMRMNKSALFAGIQSPMSDGKSFMHISTKTQ